MFEQKNQYKSLVDTLAGVVFLGTPRSISADDKLWSDTSYAIEQSSKSKTLMTAEARRKLSELSRRFMQAAADVQVLSCHELRETKAKSSLLSSSKVLVSSFSISDSDVEGRYLLNDPDRSTTIRTDSLPT